MSESKGRRILVKLGSKKAYKHVGIEGGKICNDDLYKYVSKLENFIYLNGKNVFYTKTADIVFQYASDINNYRENKYYLEKYFKIYKYVPIMLLFTTFYVQNDAQRIDLRGFYVLHFKEWSDEKKKKKKLSVKNP